MTTQNRHRILRNTFIFYIGTMVLSIGGGFIMASGQEAGGLLFVLSPLLMVLVVRFLLGDGWQNAGLKLHLKKSWRWYVFALLFTLLVLPVVLVVNTFLGFAALTMPFSQVLPLLLAGFAIQLVPRTFFGLSEEWGWRGYLEPQLSLLGVPDTQRHMLVGLLWGLWHFPLIFATDYTTVPLPVFLPLFIVGAIFLAFIYGQMRQASGSVWPCVLMHGLGNTLGYAILGVNFIAYNNELLGNIVPGSLIITLLYALIAMLVTRRHRQVTQLPVGGKTAIS